MFLSSEDFKKKFYEKYFFITWVGFMNAGAYLYYFSPEPFPAGEGVIVSSILNFLLRFIHLLSLEVL